MFDQPTNLLARIHPRHFDRFPGHASRMGQFCKIVVSQYVRQSLGSRLMGTLLARRDILVKLGYDENDKKDILNDPKFSERIKQLQGSGYRTFVDIVKLWLRPLDKNGFGYTSGDVADFLLRIYKEQNGGGELVGQDRRERRIDLKNKLALLKTDEQEPEELHSVADMAASKIEKVS